MADLQPPHSSKGFSVGVAPAKSGKLRLVLFGIVGLLLTSGLLLIGLLAPHMRARQRATLLAFGMGMALVIWGLFAALGYVFEKSRRNGSGIGYSED